MNCTGAKMPPAPPLEYENTVAPGRHWIQFELEGSGDYWLEIADELPRHDGQA